MDILIALIVGGLGLGLVLFFAEQLVKGVIGMSMGFGLSAFLLRHGAKINSQFISPCIPVAVHKHFLVSPTHCRKNLTA